MPGFYTLKLLHFGLFIAAPGSRAAGIVAI
jgi:hypothetical protein